MSLDEQLLRKTFELAELSVEHGNQPFGSLLATADGVILLTAENSEITEDKTCHAEMNLLRKMYKQAYSEADRANMTLYTSSEFCAMCACATAKSKIGRVVYGCPGHIVSEMAGGGSLPITCRDIFSRSTRKIKVEGPLLEDEAKKIHLTYWKQ
jgi:tRNA(Arg) A34 adenosine deaminase TadA